MQKLSGFTYVLIALCSTDTGTKFGRDVRKGLLKHLCKFKNKILCGR